MDVWEKLKEKAAMIEPLMRNYADFGNDSIKQMVLHPIVAGGKRVRPCMVLLACEAVGGNIEKILPAAVSVELLHTFTLVHDDIMDHDLKRRGKPTVHAIWGEELGIVVGDTLYSSAFKALTDIRKSGIDSDTILDALEVLVWANSKIQEGQIMDMLFEKRNDVKEDEYMDMIQKKTGVLIEASLEIGAILGNGSEDEINGLGRFGRYIGMAFQIQDDILGLVGDEKAVGKPIGSDITEGKKSLIVIHSLNNLKGIEKEKLLKLLGNKDIGDKELKIAKDMLIKSGSVEFAKTAVKKLCEDAKKELNVIRDSDAKNTLLELADFMIERKF